jgi:hypothetical protein
LAEAPDAGALRVHVRPLHGEGAGD